MKRKGGRGQAGTNPGGGGRAVGRMRKKMERGGEEKNLSESVVLAREGGWNNFIC